MKYFSSRVCEISDATCSRLMDDGLNEEVNSATVDNTNCWKRYRKTIKCVLVIQIKNL
jgi:hypothetical protein